jgi:hypothetical protein
MPNIYSDKITELHSRPVCPHLVHYTKHRRSCTDRGNQSWKSRPPNNAVSYSDILVLVFFLTNTHLILFISPPPLFPPPPSTLVYISCNILTVLASFISLVPCPLRSEAGRGSGSAPASSTSSLCICFGTRQFTQHTYTEKKLII